jgi:UDP-glucose/GDP-mannose dehydrogenase family, NAD binding domain
MRVAMIGTICGVRFRRDKDGAKIASLNAGEIPIYEPVWPSSSAPTSSKGGCRSARRLTKQWPWPTRCSSRLAPLPPRRRPCRPVEAAREVAAALRGFTVVITKSTVPVGTGDEVERIIRGLRPGNDVAVVSNPEFRRMRQEDRRRNLSPALSQPGPDSVHATAHCRAHQMRGQCLAGHQDHVHQRNCGFVRARRRRRAGDWRAASGSTTASGRSSCMRDRASAAPASQKMSVR